MTTAHSPRPALEAQADAIAGMLKRIERGEKIDSEFAGTIEEARYRTTVKFAIEMDDKIITLELPWSAIRVCSETDVARMVLRLMQQECE